MHNLRREKQGDVVDLVRPVELGQVVGHVPVTEEVEGADCHDGGVSRHDGAHFMEEPVGWGGGRREDGGG